MSTSALATHPLLECVRQLEAVLDEATAYDSGWLNDAEQRDLVASLERLSIRVQGWQLRVLAGPVDPELRRDLQEHLATVSLQDTAVVRSRARLADDLQRRWHHLALASTDGRVNSAQAEVIARALDELPATVTPDQLARAEDHLIALAAQFRPRDLRRLGRRILEVIAPDISDAHEQHLLEQEEARAARQTWLAVTPLGDGSARIAGRLPQLAADRLKTYLDAYTNPRRHLDTGDQAGGRGGAGRTAVGHTLPAAGSESFTEPGEISPATLGHRGYQKRLGEAFCALLEHLDPTRLPIHGGAATTVVVTVPLQALSTGVGAADTSTGRRLSAGEVRRLACTAGIIPAVLGSDSQILDLGRTRRLFSPAQRTALAVREQQCQADGCDIPAAWCEGHHTTPWSSNGPTDLSNAMLLCSRHHHRIHDHRYAVIPTPGGVAFHRRT